MTDICKRRSNNRRGNQPGAGWFGGCWFLVPLILVVATSCRTTSIPSFPAGDGWSELAGADSAGAPLPPGYRLSSVEVRAVRGAAQYRKTNGPWKPLLPGEKLAAGVTLRTAQSSGVDLFFPADQAVMRMKESTVLHIQRLIAKSSEGKTMTETLMAMPAGRIAGDTKNMSTNSIFRVTTPQGVCHIQGDQPVASSQGQ